MVFSFAKTFAAHITFYYCKIVVMMRSNNNNMIKQQIINFNLHEIQERTTAECLMCPTTISV